MNITISDIQLYEIFKEKLGNQKAEALVDFVKANLKESTELKLKKAEVKFKLLCWIFLLILNIPLILIIFRLL